MSHGREDNAKRTILCIEDEPNLRRDIVDEVSAAGYETIEAGDGDRALDLLETVRPDLILCDIALPGLDGYGLLGAARKRPDLADVPFVFLTAFNRREDVIDGKRSGADDYLVKPVDFDLMLASIESRLSQVTRMNDQTDRKLRDALGAWQERPFAGDAEHLGRVLDLLAFGTVLLDERGGVLLANRAARELHGDADGLVIDRTIHPEAPHLAGKTRAMLASVHAAAKAGTERTASMSLPRPSGCRDLVLIACALPAASGRKGQTVVFITDPERRPNVPDAVISDLFDLTPTETAIARFLSQGRRTDEISDDLDVSQTTIAFHMRNIFQKTGTHRQADLIAIILAGIGMLQPTPAPTCQAF